MTFQTSLIYMSSTFFTSPSWQLLNDFLIHRNLKIIYKISTYKTQSRIFSISLELTIFFSGSGTSKGDGISVWVKSLLSLRLLLSGSSITS